MGLCVRYRKDEELAREVLNIAFMKILGNLKSFDMSLSFFAWSKTIIIRTAIDEIRKENRYHKLNVENYNEQEKNELLYVQQRNEGLDNLAYDELIKLIEKLPALNNQVFNLFVLDGFKHKEISEMLSISEHNSKWNLHEARRKLQFMINSNQEYKINSYGE